MACDQFTSPNAYFLERPGLQDFCPASAYLTFMTALQIAISKNDVISGISERVRPIEKSNDMYDFVVVGGGSAGSVVASRLSENPKWKVLILEAGNDEPIATQIPGFYGLRDPGNDIDWNYQTEKETNACLSNNGSCIWSSAKMLGGCTAHNGMFYLRGNPTDYNNWAVDGNEGWTWDEVEPYFLKAEDNGEINRVGRVHHSTGGPQSVERFPYVPSFSKVVFEAVTELGYNLTEDLNGDQITGFTIAQTTSKNGVRQSSAAAYLRPVRFRKNLHVSLGSLVTKVIIQNGTAVGVHYYKNGELVTVKASKEVILSAGTKRSPHLLLLSGIGPTKHLKSMGVDVVKHLPGVGENLNDHSIFLIDFTINDPDTYDNNWEVAEQYLANQTGPLSTLGLHTVMGLLASNNTTPDYPDIQIHFLGYKASCAPGCIGALNSERKRIITILIIYLHPKSRGRITLASNNPLEYPYIWGNRLGDTESISTRRAQVIRRITLASNNPLEYPYIWGNRLGDISDVEGLVVGVEHAMEFADASAFKAWNFTLATIPLEACSQHIFRSNAYWKCAVKQGDSSSYHEVGTCKMGPKSDPMAVVDPKLRVHGIKGLRIADASIMPMITSGNTAAPTMMIGERAADFIKTHQSNERAHQSLVTKET